ncbi:outer membrane beta-barrel protein [Marivirga salinae]|uniref:Outer membrane beta-barrel protein n=1 Tax=Marivirga salinarum TaxID=3059078 RepID=A0AA49GCN1_9BACT|nr:outer membrane beta-barrel protein [Marivirga sp. BDSF4-3]WKK76849.2 outer membrane beta-barrel protein [Marivirga sp. BDSF4-3]
MRLIKIILFSISLVVLFPFISNAQTSCVQNLREARNFYDAGKLNDLPKLLLKCIDNGFSDEEKVEALRLVTLSYLFNEDQEKAEASYLRLLKIEPEYEVNLDSDPTELIILSERYDTDPKFFYGFKLGSAFNLIEITEYKPIYNLADSGSYEPPIGFSVGLFFQYPINEEFSANLETHYNFRNTVLNRNTESAEGNSTGIQSISEIQQWVEVPLLVNYKLPMAQNFLLEATGGPSFHYLLSSRLSVRGGPGSEINNIDMMVYRNQLNVSGILGLRANFKRLGRNFVTVEALYQYRFIDEVNMNVDRAELNWILKDAVYAENQYKGHALILRVGLRFPRFNPELIK